MLALRRLILPALTLAGLLACGGPAVDLPTIEGWAGEPQVAEAIEEARRDASRSPDAASIGRLGETFHAHDLFREAVTCYRNAMELAPASARWPYLAALATRKLEIEPALELFALAIERGGEHPALFIHQGDTLAQLDRPTEAIGAYERALALDTASTHALRGLGQVELARGEVERARAHLERAREIAPWHGDVHLLLARVYQRLGQGEDAARELLVAGAYPDPTQAADPILQGVMARAVNSLSLVDRGRRLAHAGRFAEAEQEYRRVLEIRSGSASDYSNLGGTLARQGKLDAAVGEYRKALEIEPENPYAHNNLAMALADGGDLANAVDHLELALVADPAYAEAHHNLGLLRARQGRPAEAIAHYREALRHNPSYVQAHNDLGTALGTLGDTEAAADSWLRALAIDPRELSALYNLSVAVSRGGDHAAAIEWLERGMKIAPNSSRLASLLAWELATAPESELRDGERSRQLAVRVFEAYRDQPQAADVYAASPAEIGQFEEAAAVAGLAAKRATITGQADLARQIGARLTLYRNGLPYRQER